MNSGTVVAIHVCPKAASQMAAVAEVRAVAGRGLEGDRYFLREGTWSKSTKPGRQLTLIEAEAIEALKSEHGVPFNPAESRRNITTRGIRLNDLLNREFKVGDVSVRGVRLCEPCGHLEKLTLPGVEKGLSGRGGLRVDILNDGVIRVGDSVTI